MTLVWASGYSGNPGKVKLKASGTSVNLKVTNSQDYAPKYVRYLINTEAVTPGTVDYNFGILAGTVDIDWGDGTSNTGVNSNTTHTYSSPGYYVVTISQNGTNTFRPDIGLQEISVEHESVEGGGFWDNSMASAAPNASNLKRWGSVDLGNVTSFYQSWYGCSSLTSFPLIDTSSGTNFNNTWRDCSSLTSFPLIDTSSVTNFNSAWQNCSSLTSFPLIDTSTGTKFSNTWSGCSNLTSFPLIDTSSGTAFGSAWRNCSSLTDFPANFFDSWTATPASGCFNLSWDGCSSLTATSVENILNSIDTSGQSAPAGVNKNITIDYDTGTGTPSISTAVANLKSRGWNIILNGVVQ